MAPTHRLLGPDLLLLALAGLTLAAVPLLGARMAAAPPVRLEFLGQIGVTAYHVVVEGDVAYLLRRPRIRNEASESVADITLALSPPP